MVLPKIKIYIFALSGVFILVAVLFYVYAENYSFSGNKLENIQLNNVQIKAEAVESREKIAQGLAGRDNLCENCAMLFRFSQKGKYPFWMKGMKFNLDMLWISGEKIVFIAKNVSYDSQDIITPDISADKVLELNAGMADRYGIKVGDIVSF